MKKIITVIGVLACLFLSSCEKEEIKDDNYEAEIYGTEKGDVSGPGSGDAPIQQ